jgi:superfamily I DNA/RNA helicase
MQNVFVPSPQQSTFFSWIENDQGSCILEAVAGAGKTTTLIQALKLMTGRIFFGAFNKKIAEEIQERAGLRNGLTVSTMHAAGFAAWRKVAGRVKIDSSKCKKIFDEALARVKYSHPELYPDYVTRSEAVLKLVSFAKQAAIGVAVSPKDNQAWLDLIDHFDIDTLENDSLVISLARKVLAASIAQDMEVIDYDDMIYAPLIHKVKFDKYDWVLIDEAQDTNAARRLLALALMNSTARLVAVGDRHQAIYGFTGADADALDLIASATNAKRLPLTVTYRCPKSVVAFARQFVSHIEAHESAPEGSVMTVTDKKLSEIAKPGDAILCRFTAPIITSAYQFISEGIPAKVEGRDIGNNLKKLATRWKVKSLQALIEKLQAYQEREVAKLKAKEQDTKAQNVEDSITCLLIIIDRVLKTNPNPAKPLDALCEEIDKIFDDKVSGDFVLLSTIHRSKGREWNRVIWLQTGPSKWAKKQWELDQENNLCYVAPTRAKKELVLYPYVK